MKKNLFKLFFTGTLMIAAAISYGALRPILTYALAPINDGGPYIPNLSADSYRVNANGVDTDTLYMTGGDPNSGATLYYAGPNGASGSEIMCKRSQVSIDGDCSKVYGPWGVSSAGTWSFYVVSGGGQSLPITIDFIAPPITPPPPQQKTAQLAVANNNFNLTQGVVESGSSLVGNVSSVPGSSFALSYSKVSWIVIDSATASLDTGGSGTLTFHVDNSNSQIPPRSSAPQTITGVITVAADGSGSGTTVTGSLQTITVNYTIPPTMPAIKTSATSVVINIISNGFTVTGGREPYTWFVDNVSTDVGSTFQYIFTSLGLHRVKVVDANNNNSNSLDITVTSPPASCTAQGTWDTKKNFCVGDTTTWSVISVPSGFASYAHNISNRATTANPYDTSPANQKDEAPYFDRTTNYIPPSTYVYQTWDVGFYSQQKFFLQQGGQNICSTANSWNNIAVYPLSDVRCGGTEQPPGYPKLVVSPPSATAVQQGSAVSFNATYVTLNGLNQEVNTDVTSATNWNSSNPSVASATSLPGSFNPNNPGTAAINATYNNISSGSSLTVTPVSSADFSLAADPISRTVSPGGKATYTIAVAKIGALQNPVNLHVAGSPAGASASFAPSTSITPTVNATLTVDSGSASPGTFALQIIGTSGALIHDVWLSFKINGNGGNRYSCLNNSCALDQNGQYGSLSSCTAAGCGGSGGGGPVKYSCVNNACAVDANGIYGNLSSCTAAGCGGNGSSGVTPSCTFTASSSNILRGQRTTLSWSCSGANSCSISPNVGTVDPISGHVGVSPNTTTIYTLICNGTSNVSYQNPIQVNVRNPQIEEISP